MTSKHAVPDSPSDLVARQVKDIRRRQGLTAEQLAQRCADLGLQDLTAQSISNIETGRRDETGRRRRYITVDELLGLARALGVPAVTLLVHRDTVDQPYPLTPAQATVAARSWITGESLPPEVRNSEGLGRFIFGMPEDLATELVRELFVPERDDLRGVVPGYAEKEAADRAGRQAAERDRRGRAQKQRKEGDGS